MSLPTTLSYITPVQLFATFRPNEVTKGSTQALRTKVLTPFIDSVFATDGTA